MVQEEEEEEEAQRKSWPASLPHRTAATTEQNNKLTSRLVTSRENMAARGHASDHGTIDNNQ